MDLQIKNLVASYGEKIALEIPKLHIPTGSFIGIIGPNGAGKTTLIKLIAGMDPLHRGSILYDGSSLRRNPGLYKEMTLIFQKPYLFRRSVYENVAYPLKIRGAEPKIIEKKCNALLDSLGLESLRDQMATTLSGGEAQKLALARALVFEPKLLMLDEPTANIDPQSVILMEKAIRDFYHRTGATVLMITHNIRQARRLANEVFYIDQGKLVEKGSAKEVIESPENPSTKRFIQWDQI